MKMNMRKLIWVIALGITGNVMAQDAPVVDSTRKAKMEELKKMRRDLYIKKLQLTDEEAKNFFPIFDEYQLKLRQARRAFHDKWRDKKPEDLTEEEASQYLTDAIELRTKELELFKTYSEKLKTV